MKTRILSIAAAFAAIYSVKAQLNFDFNNRHLHQSALANPGFLPQYKFSFGFRSTNSFTLDQVNLNTFFNKNESDSTSIANLIKGNSKQFGADIFSNTEIFNFGIRSKKAFFGFNSSIVAEGALRLPRDLFGLAFFGNAAYIGKTASIDLSGTQFTSYLKNQITYGRQINNELSIGVNLAYLNGLANVAMNNGYANIKTDTGVASIYQLTLSSAFDAQTSMLGVDPSMLLDSAYNANLDTKITDGISNFGLSSNRGYSIDIGGVYRLNERFRISAAIQNLGSIVWDQGAMKHSMNAASWVFKGLDTTQFKQMNNNDSNDIFTQIKDSFNSKFVRNSTAVSSYTTNLKPRFTLGVEFFPFKRTNVQMLFGTGFGVLGNKSFISTGLHQELGEIFDIRANYTLYDFSFPQHRLGVGASLNLGVIQPYFNISDIYGAADYGNASTVAASFGLNFMIGMNKDKDNDGVPDKRDSCRKVFGVLSNNGCPYGFLGESMNDESEITNEAPSFEVVPAESVADSSKTSEKSVENLPSDKSLKSETKPSEIKEIKSEIKETKVETKPSEIKEIKEETKVIENTVTETPPTTQNMETVSKPSTIDANVDSNKANINSEVKNQNKKSDKYNSKVKELTNIMKK
jgi:hypothetical protein